MEVIHHYFEPYTEGYYELPNYRKGDSLGDNTSFNKGDESWFLNVKAGVVIIGVPESRGGVINKDCDKSSLLIRRHLYSLRSIPGMNIYDAGNLKGKTKGDRYQALEDVIQYFCKLDVVIVVIGGSHDLSNPLFKSILESKENARMVIADAVVDVGEGEVTSQKWLQRLVDEKEDDSYGIDFFGLQNYLQLMTGMENLAEWESEVLWLGQILNKDINLVEVMLRQADFVSIDYKVVAGQAQWAEGVVSPHGLSPNSACAVSKYAGFSDILKVYGIFEVANNSADCLLAGQMIWHFITGVNNRKGDYPFRDIKEYKMYVVPFANLDINVSFYQNESNNRWWVGVTKNGKKLLVPCYHHDYINALNGIIPDVWARNNY